MLRHTQDRRNRPISLLIVGRSHKTEVRWSKMPVSSVGQLEQLKKMVDELGESKELSASQVAFLRTEWLHQVDLWDAWSRRANWWYYALRLLIVIGGASLPVLL